MSSPPANLMGIAGILQQLPHLTPDNHYTTSPATPDYNCIAWAAGDDQKWWWPVAHIRGSYWPEGIAKSETLASFVSAFETLGYAVCGDDALEEAFEKIAIYADPGGKPTHAARQLPSGMWTSKLGPFVDIEHTTPQVIKGPAYGVVVQVMKRLRP